MDNFSNKYINNYKFLKNALIGLEIEFFSNDNFIKTLEKLNNLFSDREVWGINQYHSDVEVTDTKFKIEPDYSGGAEMIEFITGPLSWIDAKMILIKVLTYIKENGFTDDHCSIHINISFDKSDNNFLDVTNLNRTKLILNFNEDFVYEKFPNRQNNIYAKSIKNIIPFSDWLNPNTAFNVLINNIQLPNNTKYYGINVNKIYEGYIEYRYIGGKDYENKLDDILTLMDYFIMQTKKAITEDLNEEDHIKLLAYLEKNINWYKQYYTYDDFLSNIKEIKIQVDKNDRYKNITMNWDNFKQKIFQFIINTNNIKNCIINYNTNNNRLEIIGAQLENVNGVFDVDFIECNIQNCTLYNCDIVYSEITNGHIHNSNIYDSKINNCKLLNVKATEWSELNNCVFDGGQLNCIMKNGVFRSGQILSDAEIDNSVKMASKDSFWHIDPTNKKIKGLLK